MAKKSAATQVAPTMNWKDYEHEVHEALSEMYPGARMTCDTKIEGRYSKTPRQIDILIDAEVAGFRSRVIVDAKYFSRRVDVSCVEAFISKVEDVGGTHGMLVTSRGYSKGAINRAYYDPKQIELDIINFDELQNFQAFGAIPYAGDRGLLVPAPFGWVVDGSRSTGFVASFYQRGRTWREAAESREFMYLNFWRKDKTASSLTELFEWQNKQMGERYTNLHISKREGPARSDGKCTLIRTATSDQLPCVEITGYIDFEDFIPFFVLFTIPELASKNSRKLEHLLKAALPLKISFDDKNAAE